MHFKRSRVLKTAMTRMDKWSKYRGMLTTAMERNKQYLLRAFMQ